jgi:hypothetical protein
VTDEPARHLDRGNLVNQERDVAELLVTCPQGFAARSEDAQDAVAMDQHELTFVGLEQTRALLLVRLPLSL